MFIAEVDLGKIVGTDHSTFNTDNWIKMRDTLFKKSTNEKYVAMVRDNPDHSEGLDPITVKQYGEEYILCQSGNHRVCHAKFTGFLTIRVRVRQHLIDPSLVGKPIKQQMEAIPIRLINY
ncbi:hypothetical protein SAMN04488069_107118 [Hymenobacter psychrophilus]|uniref:Uncharacterized protein n=2 Tax=Hymenobacter psychrophilus TaxID=651662 RepID=A0A1H3IQH8_9BACT|nr:hypothetical protein SAMN04488069_107118 [Hymenobacter psychrophilus]